MAYAKLVFKPGIVTESTPFAAEGSYVDGNLVRFRYGQPQQVGGWTPLSTLITGNLDGICRQMRAWKAIDSTKYLALGTNRRLYIVNGGQVFDVTPIRISGNLTDPFSTTITSKVVNVHSVNHQLAIGDVARFTGSTTVGGVTISGEYVVNTIVDSDNYTILASVNATSTVTSAGGTVAYQYLIPTGPALQTAGFGWGANVWSNAAWGTPRSQGGVPIDVGQWTFDNWGEDLIANRFAGSIYIWQKGNGTGTPGVLIPQAPQVSNSVLVTQDRFMVAYGCSDAGVLSNFDPLSIKWSTQGDYTNWTPSLTNTAGFYRINSGNVIMIAKQVSDSILVWTDLDVYVQQSLPAPLDFGFIQIATGCGPISRNTVVVQSGIAYWMGKSQFWIYRGGVQPIPCTVLRHVFAGPAGIKFDQAQKAFAGVNSEFNEVWFFYPSNGGTGEVDSYVIYNYAEDWWAIGKLERTAWIDVNPLTDSNALSVDSSGTVWVQESGDLANSTTIGSFLLSAPIDIGSGDNVMISNRFVPDFAFRDAGGSVNVTLTSMNYPASTETFTKGPYTITPTTKKVDFRLRGRQVQLRIDGQNSYWQSGAIRLDVSPDGSR